MGSIPALMGKVIPFSTREDDGPPLLTCGDCEGQVFQIMVWGATCLECGSAVDWKDVHLAFVIHPEEEV